MATNNDRQTPWLTGCGRGCHWCPHVEVFLIVRFRIRVLLLLLLLFLLLASLVVVHVGCARVERRAGGKHHCLCVVRVPAGEILILNCHWYRLLHHCRRLGLLRRRSSSSSSSSLHQTQQLVIKVKVRYLLLCSAHTHCVTVSVRYY